MQKLEMLLVGAKAVNVFGLPGCVEPSIIALTLDAATEQDVANLQATLGELFRSYRQTRQYDILVFIVDLSPLPVSKSAEGSECGYMGRCRSKKGRKLVWVRVDTSQKNVWESVISGRMVESLPILQKAIYSWRTGSV